MEEKGLGTPKVSLQFELSLSGVTQLVKAEAAVEEIVTVQEEIEVEVDDDEEGEEEESTEAKKEEETKEEEDKDGAEDGKETEETKEDEKGGDANETTKEKDVDDKKKKKKKKVKKTVDKEKKKIHKRSLTVEAYHVGPIQPYSPTILEESTDKMEELDRKDKERVMLEESRNKLESYIYHVKNKLSDDEERIGKVSTEEQRATMRKLAEDAEEWLYEDGYSADLPTMEDKYAELSAPAEKVFFRVSEMTARPAATKELTNKLDKIVSLMKKWETSMPHITEEERTGVLDKVEELKKWITEMEEEQSKADPTEDPVFNSADVPPKSKPIEVMVTKLNRKPKPKPKKNETKAENATNTTADGEEADSAENATSSDDEDAKEEEEQGEEAKKDADSEDGEKAKDEL